MSRYNKIFKITTILFSFFIFFILGNLILDYLIFQKKTKSKYFSSRPDTIYKYDIIKDKKVFPNFGSFISNINLEKFLFENNNILLSDLSNSKILLCNENGKYVTFKSDKFGFRNSNNLYGKNIPIIVGDSYGHGICHNNHFQKIQNKAINLSYSGSGPIFQSIIIKEYLAKYKTDKIIWLFYNGNDLTDVLNEKKSSLLNKHFNNKEIFNYFNKKNDIDKKVHKFYLKNLNDNIDQYNINPFEEIKNGKKFSIERVFKLTALRLLLKNLHKNQNYELSQNYTNLFDIYDKILPEISKKNIEVNFIFLPSYLNITSQDSIKKINDIKILIKEKYPYVKVHNFDQFIINKYKNVEDIYISKNTHFTYLINNDLENIVLEIINN